MAVCIERTNRELVTQQVQHAGSEIKQRADAGVSLSVIIAERAFIVSTQISQTVVKPHQPAVAESFIQFKFSSLVVTDGIGKTIRNSVRKRVAANMSVDSIECVKAC